MFTRLILASLALVGSTLAQAQPQATLQDDCDKVQSLLTMLHDFQGPLVNDHAYECKAEFLLEGFSSARVILSDKENDYWTVNMVSEEMQEIEAESKYLLLIKQLMRCTYLNSWKGSEKIVGEGIYHYNFRQTISRNDHYKTILVSYYKMRNKPAYQVEITFTN